MRPILTSFLPKSHINRNIKQDVLYADIQSKGLSLRSLYLTQGIKNIIELLEHTWKNSTTGHFMCTSLEYLRLELGINLHILSSNYKKYSSVLDAHTWITNTWEFISKHEIFIDVDPQPIPIKREQDSPIMHILIESKLFTQKELKSVNKCRIYLNAFMLSDIVSGNEKKISSQAWNGIKNTYSMDKSITWPNMSCPSPNMWNVWQSVLHRGLCSINNKLLDNPLRKWFAIPPGWSYFIHNKTNELYYLRDDDTFQVHPIVSARQRQFQHDSKGFPVEIDSTLHLLPTTIHHQNGNIYAEGTSGMSTDTLPDDESPTSTHYKNGSFQTFLNLTTKKSGMLYIMGQQWVQTMEAIMKVTNMEQRLGV